MAAAVLDMEKQLKKEIEVQKTNKIIYPDETGILDKASEIKDKILIQAIKKQILGGRDFHCRCKTDRAEVRVRQ